MTVTILRGDALHLPIADEMPPLIEQKLAELEAAA